MSDVILEILVEEESMRSFLVAWLDDYLPEECAFEVYAHQGKADLLGKLEKRLKGYSNWLPANHRIIVIVDRDNDDCVQLKSDLEKICEDTGLLSRRRADGLDWQVVTRIAVEELEAWYFGDWEAVSAAYERVSANVTRKARYRNPDAVRGGTWEAFERIMQKAGYFSEGLRKREVAEAIGNQIDPERSRSHSFRLLCEAIAEACT